MESYPVSICLFILQLLIVDNTGLLFASGRNNHNNKNHQYNLKYNNNWKTSSSTKRPSLFLKSFHYINDLIPRRRYENDNHKNLVRGGGYGRNRLFKPLSSSTISENENSKNDRETILTMGEDDINFLEMALSKNVMFHKLLSLSEDERSNDNNMKKVLFDSFECISVPKDMVLFQQGQEPSEDGGYVYVLAEGSTCSLQVDNKFLPEPYGTLKGGSIIGEQAILYNTTRVATVFVNGKNSYPGETAEVKLYRISGTILNRILRQDEESSSISSNTAEELERIEDAIQEISGSKSMYGGSIIRPWGNSRWWLWTKCWSGTILSTNWKHAMYMMLYSFAVVKLCDSFIPSSSTIIPSIQHIWSYQMSLTTFIVTFFVGQAFTFWRSIYDLTRKIQGQISNFHLLLAANAKRDTTGSYTSQASTVLDDVAHFSRLFHCFLWASYAKRYSVLLTKAGLQTMACRGLLTSDQYKVLCTLEEQHPNAIPQSSKLVPLLEWMLIRGQKGCDERHIRDPYGVTSKSLQEEATGLRGSCFAISGKIKGRMPRAYSHLVQILVDSFLLLAPWGLHSKLLNTGSTIVCVGMLTLFYGGLLDLAKAFLDPLENDETWSNTGAAYLDLSVLIREANAGSTVWKNAGSILPFSV